VGSTPILGTKKKASEKSGAFFFDILKPTKNKPTQRSSSGPLKKQSRM
jgi:hypothetical protein